MKPIFAYDLFDSHADFNYEAIDDVIVIYDLDRGNRSVTHDIEYVLNVLKTEIPNIASKKVIYRDSTGIFDGIKIDDGVGKFTRFYSINERDLSKALEKLRT